MVKKIYSYSAASKGSEELARRMGIRRVKHERSKVVGSPDLTLINWGSSNLPEHLTRGGTRIINPPGRVAVATDKLQAFRALSASAVRTPVFSTDLAIARHWLDEGITVFARTILTGHSGNGIVIMDPDDEDARHVRAPLYTQYVKKKDEYRIHVVNGVIIDRQKKGLKEEFQGRADVNFMIRNLQNGFIYARQNIVVPADVDNQALAAVAALQLNFGAVDVIWNERQQQAYVLEVNTAPGLTGTTLENYANALGAL